MENKMKFLRILFLMMLIGVPYVGYVMYTITRGEPTGRGHVPTPLMKLIMLAIICISLLLAYNFYKENEGG